MDVRLVDLPLPVSAADASFVADCLGELFAPIAGRASELRVYLDTALRSSGTSILVIEVEGQRAGLITLVRYAMPRYLGHAYEIQELVVAPPFRGRGVARLCLALVAERCKADPQARKVLIRTNAEGAKRAYASVWGESDLTAYQTMLNLLGDT
jgi:ribosomal protein S18 acetylase RimI-like enzyme